MKEILKKVKNKNLKSKRNNEINKNFINDESLLLRENLQKALFDKFDEINIIKNLNYHQYKSLLYFRQNKPFQIINCDKNVGFAIISTELYDKSALDYLNNDSAYLSIENNQLFNIVENINNKLNELFLNNHISKYTKNTLFVINSKVKSGIFRMMSKVHKKMFGWRPILNCINHPTSSLSIFFDNLFKPFVFSSKSYIKDSQNLIQKVYKLSFQKKPFIYSIDICNLYPSIEPNHAVPILTEFISKYLDTTHLTAYGLSSLLNLFFENNIFSFKTYYYIQKKGLPMGCVCGPTLANLYLYILECKWLVIHNPLIYARFIDDTCLVQEYELDINEFQNIFGYLKITLNTGEKVNFLDVYLSFNNITDRLKFSLYIKDTHVNKYLLPSSNHPKHIFKNIIFNLMLRIKRICTDYFDFVEAAKDLSLNLLERGYEAKEIRRVFNIVSNLDRNSLIPYKKKVNNLDFSKNIPFFFMFNSNFSKFNKDLFSTYYKTTFNYPILNNFSLNNNIDSNLNSLLVHNFIFSTSSSFKTYKCKDCRICNFIYNFSFIKLNDKYYINLLSNGSCLSSNLVYIILCLKCKIFYIGETKNSLKERITQHLDDIAKFIPFHINHKKEVARHFNLKGHNYLLDFKCTIFKDKINDSIKRKATEMDLLHFLNKFNNNTCMNIKTERNNYNTLCFT